MNKIVSESEPVSLREYLMLKLLKEALPYLQTVEYSTKTSVALRALIDDINGVIGKEK